MKVCLTVLHKAVLASVVFLLFLGPKLSLGLDLVVIGLLTVFILFLDGVCVFYLQPPLLSPTCSLFL